MMMVKYERVRTCHVHIGVKFTTYLPTQRRGEESWKNFPCEMTSASHISCPTLARALGSASYLHIPAPRSIMKSESCSIQTDFNRKRVRYSCRQ